MMVQGILVTGMATWYRDDSVEMATWVLVTSADLLSLFRECLLQGWQYGTGMTV